MSGGSKLRADVALVRRLLGDAREQRGRIAGVLALSLLGIPLALLLPIPIKIAIDNVLGGQPVPGVLDAILPGWATDSGDALLLVAAALVVVVALLRLLQQLGYEVLRTSAGERLALRMRGRLFEHVQRLSFAYHDLRGTTDTTYRIQYDAPSVQYVAVDALISLVTSVVTVVAMAVIVARIDIVLALIALAVLPVLAVIARVARTRLRDRWHEAKELESGAMSVVQEVLGSLRVVKAFGQESREHARFVHRSTESMHAKVRLAWMQGLYQLAVGLAIATTFAALLLVGVHHVQSGRITLGDLVLLVAYLAQLFEPMRNTSEQTASLQASLAGAERVFAVIDEVPDVLESPEPQTLGRARGDIRFDDVSFEYLPGRPALRGVSLSLPPGARLGIKGTTGAGKTTLVSLLMRFYDPVMGRILLDGIDVRDLALDDLRNQFSVVLQEPVLFSASIAENIAYARPHASPEEIVAAAAAAGADGFVAALPDGYDTLVGERGILLSGGERQRLSLARAFLKDAPILILDEPTSSVDLATEAQIMASMTSLMEGRTSIMIAHRTSTLEACDLVIRLDDGVVREVAAA